VNPETAPLAESGEESAPPASRPNFSVDVLKLVTGTTFAQILTIIASPVLTRLFSPEAFGLLAIFTSITKVLGVVACLRYEFAIMLPDDERDAVNLLGLCIAIVTGISLLALPFFIIFEPVIVSVLNAPGLTGYLWLVSPFVFVSGLFIALNYWNSRTRRYGRLSVARILSSVAITGGQLAAGAAGMATGGALIGASALGQGVGTAVLGAQILRDDRQRFANHLSFARVRAVLVRYKRFPLYDSWSALLNVSSWQLPSLLLPIFFSPTQVGYYALAFRLIVLPMDLIGSAIQQVFFQRASNAERAGNLGELTESVFTVLLRIGLFPMLTLALIGQELFTLVFGAAWSEAGVYTQLLAVWAVVWFISAPLSTIYMVQEKQAFGLQINIANFVTRFAALVTGGLLGSARLAILLFGVSGIAVYGFLCIRLLMFSGIAMRRTLRLVADALLPFLPVGAVLLVLELLGTPAIIHLALAFIANVVYYVHLLRTDPQFREILGGFGIPGMR
jgi:O-antigen/teichoic acid export membrane protein